MSINLIAMIMQQLSPDLLGRLAGALNAPRDQTEGAVKAAVPGLLAALTGLASTPAGAQQLDDAIGQQDPGVLGSLADAIGGPGQQALVDNGSSLLSSLLGGQGVDGLMGAISRFAGLGEGSAKTLLGIAGPLVMGVLGRQKRESGLDAGGLAQLLLGQKDQIAAALPGDFAKLLGGTGLLAGLGDAAARFVGAGGAAAGAAGATAAAFGTKAANAAGDAAAGAAQSAAAAARSASAAAQSAADAARQTAAASSSQIAQGAGSRRYLWIGIAIVVVLVLLFLMAG